MWLIFAILTVLLWGTSETIFKSVSNNEKNTVLKLIASNGLMLGLFGLIFMIITKTEMNFEILKTYFPVAIIYITSMFCTYKAMRLVKISILSPVQNSSCLITTILCVAILKQELAIYQIIAIAMIIIGMILLSINKDETKRLDMGEGEEKISKAKAYSLYLQGFLFALGYFVLDGVASFMDDYTLEANLSAEQVLIAYSFIYAAIGAVCLAYLLIAKKWGKFEWKTERKKLIGTVVESAGQYTYIYAYAFGEAALASPFIASYSIVSIILSRIFLKEKLCKKQWILISIILVGMIMLSIE